MAASDRVGPGVLVVPDRPSDDAGLSEDEVSFATALNHEGFTALLLEGPYGDHRDDVLDAAGDFLRDNWHPRLGLIAFGGAAGPAAGAAVRLSAEALVIYGGRPAEGWDPGAMAVLGHLADSDAGGRAWFEALAGAGTEAEVWGYAGDLLENAEALERTVDFLHYYLS